MENLIKKVAIGTTKTHLNGLYLPIKSMYKNGQSWLKDSIQNNSYKKRKFENQKHKA